jgi:HSP20 family protein
MSAFRQETFDRQMDRVLDEALRAFGTSDRWTPPCNVWEDENGFYVQVALPGWEANQIALEVNNQMLAVKGERQGESLDNGRYHLQEIGGTRFARMFRLPAFVDQEKASATHKHGLLTISIPKREEAKRRRIQIDGQ